MASEDEIEDDDPEEVGSTDEYPDHVCRLGLKGIVSKLSLSLRAVADVAEIEEPGQRGGTAGARGRVAVATGPKKQPTGRGSLPGAEVSGIHIAGIKSTRDCWLNLGSAPVFLAFG